MPQPFVGEIKVWAGNFAPTGWALCNGQILPIAQNTALFSIIGTAYGGNGVNTFALPDLRGRVPISMGQGPGLTSRTPGQMIGSESHPLSAAEMPSHTHTLAASTFPGNSDAPAANFLARSPAAIPQYHANADATLDPSVVSQAGGSQPHNNMQPYLTLNFIIALQGIYPGRWE